MADTNVDNRYGAMRKRHGTGHASANGYVGHWFFAREQRFLLPRIEDGLTLDIACGSGLMLKPRDGIIGVDFNATACEQAVANGLNITRGDAFQLPFSDNCFDSVVNCQFLNQQNNEQTLAFIREAARVLKPGGKLHITWRGAETLIHKTVHFLSTTLNTFRGDPNFPQYGHRPQQLIQYAEAAGLKPCDRSMTLPLGPSSITPDTLLARLLGASHYMCFEKRS